MIAIRIDQNDAIQRLDTVLRDARNPRQVMAVVGREAGNRLKKHFREKDATEPNKLGGPRTHFWLQVDRSVSAPVVDSLGRTVTITITHSAFAQKLFGGPITAKRVRNLAIPLTPEAYGRAPATFERETGLKLIFLKQRTNALLAAVVPQGLIIEYLLTPRVDQPPDPTALPNLGELADALVEKAQEVVDRQNQ